jgi:hypothetical protein
VNQLFLRGAPSGNVGAISKNQKGIMRNPAVYEIIVSIFWKGSAILAAISRRDGGQFDCFCSLYVFHLVYAPFLRRIVGDRERRRDFICGIWEGHEDRDKTTRRVIRNCKEIEMERGEDTLGCVWPREGQI